MKLSARTDIWPVGTTLIPPVPPMASRGEIERAIELEDVERRQGCRLSVNLAAVYRSRQLVLDAQISCLSSTGLRLSCAAVDVVGAEASVRISMVDAPQPLVVEGTVVWLHTHAGHFSEMGVRFGRLGRNTRAELANFILRSSHLRRIGT